jgi:hypothetical protein
MIRAELRHLQTILPKTGDALTQAHYVDLNLRIKEALNPTRPIVNLPGTTRTFIDVEDMKDTYINCWPKYKTE